MNADRDFCLDQVKRLDALTHKPSTVPGWTELLNTLRASAHDNVHAKRIIDEWIEENTCCPTPRDIRDVALRTRQQSWTQPLSPACPVCSGIGWKVMVRRDREGNQVEGVTRCDCARKREATQQAARSQQPQDELALDHPSPLKNWSATVPCVHASKG